MVIAVLGLRFAALKPCLMQQTAWVCFAMLLGTFSAIIHNGLGLISLLLLFGSIGAISFFVKPASRNGYYSHPLYRSGSAYFLIVGFLAPYSGWLIPTVCAMLFFSVYLTFKIGSEECQPA